jgi:hypothetical protein
MRDTLRSPSTEKETKTKKGKTRDAPRSPSTLFYSQHRHRFTFFGLQPLPQIKKKKHKIYNHIILATMVFISIPNQTQTPPPFIPSSSPSSTTKPTSPFITSSEFIYANPTLYALKTDVVLLAHAMSRSRPKSRTSTTALCPCSTLLTDLFVTPLWGFFGFIWIWETLGILCA